MNTPSTPLRSGFAFAAFLLVSSAPFGLAGCNPGAPESATPSTYVPPRIVPLKVTGKASGVGVPLGPDGKPVPSILDEDPAYRLAAWTRIDTLYGDEKAEKRPSGTKLELKDDTDKPWPCVQKWDHGSAYFLIPYGYDKCPKKLTASVLYLEEPVGTAELPKLPDPVKPTPPALTAAWAGLTAEAAQSEGRRKSNVIQIQSPLGPGGMLLAKVVGVSGSSRRPDQMTAIKKGEAAGPETLMLSPSLFYPDVPATVYVEVVEMAPKHVSKRIDFNDVPLVQRFGQPYLAAASSPVELSKGVWAVLYGEDVLPLRAGNSERKSLPVRVGIGGLVSNVKCALVQPAVVEGHPLTLKSFGEDPHALEIIKSSAEGQTPIKVSADVEADVYVEKRRAIIAVRMNPAKMKKVQPPKERPLLVPDIDHPPVPK